MSTSSRPLFTLEVDDQVADAPSVPPERSVTFDRTHGLIAAIAFASAVVAFVAVRAWFVPVGAAAVVPATVIVESQPAGALLMIDGQPRGTTPLTFSMAPGQHTLLVRAGRTERAVKVTLGSGAQVAQYFDLTTNAPAVPPGRLSIITEPAGARVTIDGRPRGVSPLVIEGLAAGAHTLSVASDTGSAQRTITVVDGVAAEVVFTLARPAAPVAGWITVASPFPVDVIEHDEVVGTSGRAKIMLAAGRHEVILRSDTIGFEERRTIEIAPGAVSSIEVVAPSGLLNVNARPWADVLIDGNPAGQTPLANIQVTAGPHQITFRHPQLGERIERVVVGTSGVSRVAVDLNK
jgi:hypothetical protein